MRNSRQGIQVIGVLACSFVLASATSHADTTVSGTFTALVQGNGTTTGGSFSESNAYGGEFLWQNATFTPTSGALQAYPLSVSPTWGALSSTPFGAAANDFITFCIQINENVNGPPSGPYGYTEANLADAPVPYSTNPSGAAMGSTAAALMEQLWWQHITSHFTDPGSPFARPYALANQTDIGAFQLLMWKLTYDGAGANVFNPNAGYLTLPNSGDGAVAQTWLAQLQADQTNYLGGYANLVALASGAPINGGNLQDQVAESQYHTNLVRPIPEPASVFSWLGILGLAIGVGGYRARRPKR